MLYAMTCGMSARQSAVFILVVPAAFLQLQAQHHMMCTVRHHSAINTDAWKLVLHMALLAGILLTTYNVKGLL